MICCLWIWESAITESLYEWKSLTVLYYIGCWQCWAGTWFAGQVLVSKSQTRTRSEFLNWSRSGVQVGSMHLQCSLPAWLSKFQRRWSRNVLGTSARHFFKSKGAPSNLVKQEFKWNLGVVRIFSSDPQYAAEATCYCQLWVPLLGTSCTTSNFNRCWFELAIRANWWGCLFRDCKGNILLQD